MVQTAHSYWSRATEQPKNFTSTFIFPGVHEPLHHSVRRAVSWQCQMLQGKYRSSSYAVLYLLVGGYIQHLPEPQVCKRLDNESILLAARQAAYAAEAEEYDVAQQQQ